MSTTGTIDRAALVRRAFIELVASRGFHGATMAAVAERAGVATGTIYVHHASKDDLVLAAYRHVKRDLGFAATTDLDPAASPDVRFRVIWRNVLGYLAAHPEQARFLLQVDASPFAGAAHAAVLEDGDDALVAQASAPDMTALLVDLPSRLLYELAFAPAIRLAAANDVPLVPDVERRVAAACWRAVTKPGLG